VSSEIALPIYARCAEDFSHEAVDLDATARRAWRRQADAFGLAIPEDDPALAWPDRAQRVTCLLDGLDEVALGDQHQKRLFQKLADKTTAHHRFVVFSRPGAIPPRADLGDGVVVVRVQPFSPNQVAAWLTGWNRARPEAPSLLPAQLTERGVDALVRTPILLFMVAFTWERHVASGAAPSLAEIYEGFFVQIAAGKVAVDLEKHGPIGEASTLLRTALQNRGVLGDRAELADAMLWLMARVAWEAQLLEQRTPPEPLTRRHVDNLLHGELELRADAAHAIQIGLVLAMQADLRGSDHPILFGHQSFREFLVGRHWAAHLHRLVRGRPHEWTKLTAQLHGGRLLGEQNQSLDFLIQLVSAPPDLARTASPLTWTELDRASLIEWAQHTFADDSQVFARAGSTRLADDLRAPLREAALAIGSRAPGSRGLRAPDPETLRSLLAWFWLHNSSAKLRAPRLDAQGAQLQGVELVGADVQHARLDRANLARASLYSCQLNGTKLTHAVLTRLTMVSGSLANADLSDAILALARVSNADLSHAVLDRARMTNATLELASLAHARLCGTDLAAATLEQLDCRHVVLIEATLTNARVILSDCTNARFEQTNLRRARFDRCRLIGTAFHQCAMVEAVFVGCDLRGTDFTTSILDGITLTGAEYDEHTAWPDGFDPVAHGAILAAPAGAAT
jgi:uncharacterized protein YjbI with pentapeptide repeats